MAHGFDWTHHSSIGGWGVAGGGSGEVAAAHPPRREPRR
jgi:hypothetical protein